MVIWVVKIMTGWRMGWSVWPEKLIPHVNKLIINSVSCVNAPSQFAGIAAYMVQTKLLTM